jgi:hypothetical protein
LSKGINPYEKTIAIDLAFIYLPRGTGFGRDAIDRFPGRSAGRKFLTPLAFAISGRRFDYVADFTSYRVLSQRDGKRQHFGTQKWRYRPAYQGADRSGLWTLRTYRAYRSDRSDRE